MAADRALWADVQRDLEVARANVADAASRARSLEERGEGMEPDVRLDREIAIGVMLHNGYGAIETALERLIQAIDGGLPAGRNYHAQLIRRAAAPVPGVRPAMLSTVTAADLDRLRQFRHVIRHAYGDYDYARAAENVAIAVRAVAAFEADLADLALAVGLIDPPLTEPGPASSPVDKAP